MLKLTDAQLEAELTKMTDRAWNAGGGTNCAGNDKDKGPFGVSCHHA